LISYSITSATTATIQKHVSFFNPLLSQQRHPTKKKSRFLINYFYSKRHQTKEKFDFPLRLLVSQQGPTNKEIHRMYFVYINPFPARATRKERALAFRLLPSLPSKSHQSDNKPAEMNTYTAD
jgi:hypothetical protein